MQDTRPIDAPHIYESPPYCLTCGSLEFAFREFGIWCVSCFPPMVAPVRFPYKWQVANKLKNLAPIADGEAVSTVPAMPWFRPSEVLAAWPDGWEPPKPCAASVAAMAMRERLAKTSAKAQETKGQAGE